MTTLEPPPHTPPPSIERKPPQLPLNAALDDYLAALVALRVIQRASLNLLVDLVDGLKRALSFVENAIDAEIRAFNEAAFSPDEPHLQVQWVRPSKIPSGYGPCSIKYLTVRPQSRVVRSAPLSMGRPTAAYLRRCIVPEHHSTAVDAVRKLRRLETAFKHLRRATVQILAALSNAPVDVPVEDALDVRSPSSVDASREIRDEALHIAMPKILGLGARISAIDIELDDAMARFNLLCRDRRTGFLVSWDVRSTGKRYPLRGPAGPRFFSFRKLGHRRWKFTLKPNREGNEITRELIRQVRCRRISKRLLARFQEIAALRAQRARYVRALVACHEALKPIRKLITTYGGK